ncbi:MAG TPA: hypothetical protein DCZ95_03360 [Verrucomicrobia bacterium]|nr:MAG: hypothetical protein A2X46_01605 [Lentisphaerae bacterium GWF2_57_35]HBA83111.1 hypothetical protein [Verrucomicrobiota bacterium]
MTSKKARPPMKSLSSTQFLSYLTHNRNPNLNHNLHFLIQKEITIKIMITIMSRNQNDILPAFKRVIIPYPWDALPSVGLLLLLKELPHGWQSVPRIDKSMT